MKDESLYDVVRISTNEKLMSRVPFWKFTRYLQSLPCIEKIDHKAIMVYCAETFEGLEP